jgi:hypothetical protein
MACSMSHTALGLMSASSARPLVALQTHRFAGPPHRNRLDARETAERMTGTYEKKRDVLWDDFLKQYPSGQAVEGVGISLVSIPGQAYPLPCPSGRVVR